MTDIVTAETMSGSLPADKWVTTSEVPDPSPLPVVVGWHLLIRPLEVKAKTKGGILLPDNAKSDLEYLLTVGRVLAMGPLSYKFEENGPDFKPWCKVGDYVLFEKYAGAKQIYKGVKVIFLQDKGVRAVIGDPAWIDPHRSAV